MSTEPFISEDLVKFAEDLGYERGMAHAREHERLAAFGERLGRSLTPYERNVLIPHVTNMTTEHFFDFMFNTNPNTLAEWLKELTASVM